MTWANQSRGQVHAGAGERGDPDDEVAGSGGNFGRQSHDQVMDKNFPGPSADSDHTRIHAGRPQTNGHVEALHKTILDECWRPAFARYLYLRFQGLRRELRTYLNYYNLDRAHN